MKKKIYIAAFVLLGILLQFIIHAVIEIWYIDQLLRDFQGYSFGISWQQWFIIHHIGTAVLFVGGALFGFWLGRFWWRIIYEQRQNLPRKLRKEM